MPLLLLCMVPFLDVRAFLQSLKRPICAAPIALVLLALVGTLWSDAAWGARLYAVNPTVKLLVLPVLLYHFERSPRGHWVFVAFLVSCALLSVMSWLVAFYPDLALKTDPARARHLRQELHRPEPGIHAVRGRARLSDRDAAAREALLARRCC